MNWDWKNNSRRVELVPQRPPQRFRVPRPEIKRQPKQVQQRVVTRQVKERRPSPAARRKDVRRVVGPAAGHDTVEAQRIVSDMNEDDMRRVLVNILRESDFARAKAKDVHQYGVRAEAVSNTSPPPRAPRPPPNRKELKKWDNVHDLSRNTGFANVWSNHAGARRQEIVNGRVVDWSDTIRVDFESEKARDFRLERTQTAH